MTMNEIREVLLFCVAINYAILFIWFGVFLFAHDPLYRMHTRWFKISVSTFDATNYIGMAAYKIGIILLNLVPWIALVLSR